MRRSGGSQSGSSAKTVLFAILCVLAIAVAGVSAYKVFGPQGKTTYGGTFGTKAGEVRQDARVPIGPTLSGAPTENGTGGMDRASEQKQNQSQ